jgi:sucrose phosphorylase
MEVLVEIHAYYQQQIEIARHVDRVYDFALPPLLLHAFYRGTARFLKRWLAISPRNAVTVLDTHDGIGVIDVGADRENPVANPGLMPPEDLDAVIDGIHERSSGQSRQATGAAASNLDLYQVNCTFYDALGRKEYQVNCTFYDALGRKDKEYLLARAIQFFCPGIPQVYYVGLLAGVNDMKLLAETEVGRDINRHYFTPSELPDALAKPVVQDLVRLIRFRNERPAFDGLFTLQDSEDHVLVLRWDNQGDWARLRVDFRELNYILDYGDGEKTWRLNLFEGTKSKSTGPER